MKDEDFSGIHPDSFPPANDPGIKSQSRAEVTPPPGQSLPDPSAPTQPETPVLSPPTNMDDENHSKFSFLKKKIFVLVFLLLFLVAGSAGAFFYLNKKVTGYTLIPDDTHFYLALSVKKHPQVQKLLDLGRMMPGGEKMIKYLDDHRSELFGARKDPFKNILDLADTEVFLAKISSDPPPVIISSGRTNTTSTLEHLVNIVEFKNSKAEKDAFKKLGDDSNIILTNEAYGSAQVAKLELKSQSEEEKTDTFSTGLLPYQVTLPLSKSIFATSINKYLIAAEQEDDVKKVIDIATNAKEKKLVSLAEDEDHTEVSSHFPKEYLVKFYQRQVLAPFSNLSPGTTLPLIGGNYDTTEQSAEGDNVFTTKRGLSIVAQDNGVDFTSYQLTKKSRISEGLKHGFTIENSLANRLPSVFNSNQPFIYTEVKNIKGAIEDQLEQLEDVAKNSSDENQKKNFEDAKRRIEDLKKKFKEEFEIDADSDLLSWMESNAAMIFTAGFGGKAPELLFVFEVDNANDVETKLSKIKLRDYSELQKQSETLSRDSIRRSDLSQMRRALELYYQDERRYPKTQQELEGEYIYKLPKDPKTEELYVYKSLNNGGGYEIRANLELSEPLVVTNQSAEIGYSYYDKVSKIPKISAKVDTYNDINFYSYPLYSYKDDQYTFRFAADGNFAVMSFGTSDQSMKDIFDFEKTSSNTLATEVSWQEQFARAPKNLGSVAYIVPENIMGLVDYFTMKEPSYKEYVNDDWMTILRGYLKSLKSIGITTTQEGKTLISNSFVNVQKLGDDENRKVEEALDRVLNGKGVGSRQNQARDSARKSDVGQLATALQAYYTSPGNGKYPETLDELTKSGDIKIVPKDPATNENYGYLKCNNAEVAVYAKLEDTGTYWVWSSETGRAVDSKVASAPSSCNVFGEKSGLNWKNLLPI